ncbi:MAG TPA: hypothetical protein PLQ03_04625 [Brevundimonas sp.]|uniref:hypothetical protein n=1 Tax=Brevundimonas sp. TaxID=1871086 RepID=UPI00261B49A6|nr:hypothetical protein [Brevundimonas sp.]HRO32679.1 hypothetical protein [Brevundimonas sp.]
MSADEFDPFVERLFAQTPPMADADLFALEVQGRLAKRSRVRTVVLGVAGLLGGLTAVREVAGMDLAFGRAAIGGGQMTEGARSVVAAAQSDIQGSLDQMGLANLSLGSMGAMQLFWLTAAALVALLAAGAMKLSQEM